MLLLHSEKSNSKKSGPGYVRFPGICRHAAMIGIRRETLWKYLSGFWPMPMNTRARYERVLASERESTR
jgi:hypothetical protein